MATETQRTIRVGIVGYGNLGRSVEKLVQQQPDMELVGIFSRRDSLETETSVFPVAQASEYADQIDVLFLCLGSATDIPEQAPGFAENFNTVDTYDNHTLIPQHRKAMDEAAKKGGNVALISTGWDPGMFSLNRTMGEAFFPKAQQNSFWGTGLSQGHSDAVRRVEGVKYGVQYTVPATDAIEAARAGKDENINKYEAHERRCYIVAEESEHERIRETIETMPDYFEPYKTEVNFISEDEFLRDHQGMPHGGRVITTGDLEGSQATIEYSLDLEANPDFTAAVQVAYGRAAARLAAEGRTGAVTVLEVPPYLLSSTSLDELVERDI